MRKGVDPGRLIKVQARKLKFLECVQRGPRKLKFLECVRRGPSSSTGLHAAKGAKTEKITTYWETADIIARSCIYYLQGNYKH